MRLARDELRLHFGAYFSDVEIRRCREPPWLTSELVQTAAARQKLAQWFADGGLARPVLTLEQIHLALHVEGCRVLHSRTSRVVRALPPPVQRYAIDAVTFLVAGRETLGWCGSRPDLGRRPFVIVLSAPWHRDDDTEPAIRRLAAHEIGHSWLMPEPSLDARALSSFEWETLQQIPADRLPARHHAFLAAARAQARKDEQQVEALLRDWRFV